MKQLLQNMRDGTTEVVEVDDELVAAFERLTPQLSSSSPAPGPDDVLLGEDTVVVVGLAEGIDAAARLLSAAEP